MASLTSKHSIYPRSQHKQLTLIKMVESKKKSKGRKAPSAADTTALSDPRFADFATDPKFRLPSKKHTRTKIDSRFSRMLKDDDFTNTATVDRYGRKLSQTGKKKALQRLYQPEEESESEEDKVVEEDDVVEKELMMADNKYDAARGGGFSSSEDDSESEIEEEVDVEKDEAGAFPDMKAEQNSVPMGEVTNRIAVVNLDWDNIRAEDLYAVFSSFLSGGGRIEKLAVYKSEFGKERMEREEMEGPPREIFGRQGQAQESSEEYEKDSEDESDSEEEDEKIKQNLLKADDGEEFDSGALRQYQLERLRYYYAVITFSDKNAALKVYEATDGTEYLTSANFFDLRFIPDDTEFEDKPRDECTSIPSGYRPTEFVTDALQHSKVKLTWDAEDTSRKETINKAFTGSRAEIGENDLRAYLGSDSESDDEEDAEADAQDMEDADDTPKLTKKELARQKMRLALGLPVEPLKSTGKKEKAPVGDMQITFTAGLSGKDKDDGGVFVNKPIIEETTAEAYIRKEKERKARRKAKAHAAREGKTLDGSGDEGEAKEEKTEEKEDLGFDDPFFATDEVVKTKAAVSLRKEARAKKHAEKMKAKEEAESQRAELELLMTEGVGEDGQKLEHFDINEIARAERQAKKGKRGKKGKLGKPSINEDGELVLEDRKGALQSNFKMDVADERFGKLFESHEFAIDTSNPKFKATEGMKKLLEEGRKRRMGDTEALDEPEVAPRKEKKRKAAKEENADADELRKLVESVKKKAKR